MGRSYDLHHVRPMVAAFLDNGLKGLKRICSLEIVERTDEYRAVFMGHIADSL